MTITPEQLFEAFVARLNKGASENLWRIFDAAVQELKTQGSLSVTGIQHWPDNRGDDPVLSALMIPEVMCPEWLTELEVVVNKIGKDNGYTSKRPRSW